MDTITPSELAKRAGVSVRTIQRWAATGKLPGIPKNGYHRSWPALPELFRAAKRLARDGGKGNQKGDKTRISYERNAWKTLTKAGEKAANFLRWLDTISPLIPKKPLKDFSPEDWQAIPVSPSRAHRRKLIEGAEELGALAKIGRLMLEAGIFDAG